MGGGGEGTRDEPRLVMELNTETPIERGSQLILSYAGFKNEGGVARRITSKVVATLTLMETYCMLGAFIISKMTEVVHR